MDTPSVCADGSICTYDTCCFFGMQNSCLKKLFTFQIILVTSKYLIKTESKQRQITRWFESNFVTFYKVASSRRLVSFFIFSHAEFRAAPQLTERLEEAIYGGHAHLTKGWINYRTSRPHVKPDRRRTKEYHAYCEF